MPEPTPVIVVGAATGLLEVTDLVNAINADAPRFTILGALDDDVALHGKKIGGIEVLGGLSLARTRPDVRFVFAISSYKLRLKRIEIFESMGVARDRFVTLIHPRADVSPVAGLGHGCTIYSGAFVATHVNVGDFSIIYNSAVVSPYCELGDFAMVAGLAFLAARVKLGTGAFAGGGGRQSPRASRLVPAGWWVSQARSTATYRPASSCSAIRPRRSKLFRFRRTF